MHGTDINNKALNSDACISACSYRWTEPWSSVANGKASVLNDVTHLKIAFLSDFPWCCHDLYLGAVPMQNKAELKLPLLDHNHFVVSWPRLSPYTEFSRFPVINTHSLSHLQWEICLPFGIFENPVNASNFKGTLKEDLSPWYWGLSSRTHNWFWSHLSLATYTCASFRSIRDGIKIALCLRLTPKLLY